MQTSERFSNVTYFLLFPLFPIACLHTHTHTPPARILPAKPKRMQIPVCVCVCVCFYPLSMYLWVPPDTFFVCVCLKVCLLASVFGWAWGGRRVCVCVCLALECVPVTSCWYILLPTLLPSEPYSCYSCSPHPASFLLHSDATLTTPPSTVSVCIYHFKFWSSLAC